MNDVVPPSTETATDRAAAPPMSPWRAAMAAMVGSVLEYYDFFAYGPLAAIALGAVFFDDSIDPAFATMLSLLTFAAGFLARPIGGIVIGHFRVDRHHADRDVGRVAHDDVEAALKPG